MADKSLNEIRNTFLDYFEKNDHKIVESSMIKTQLKLLRKILERVNFL